MISCYSGKCVYCDGTTKAGVDHYDTERKESFHEACQIADENRPPGPEAIALADRLGFQRVTGKDKS